MTTVAAAMPISLPRRTLRILLALFVVAAGLSLAGVSLAPTPAQAAPVSIAQCNGQNGGPSGATTGITCAVTVVNTINGGARSSTVTVTRTCSSEPCEPGDTGGLLRSVTTSYPDVVTSIAQCNNSGNDAAPPLITCTVSVTNNISADTPGAQPVTAATVNQCVGTGGGGGQYGGQGPLVCNPFPASTSGATVTECNGSVNGGGSAAVCSVAPASDVSPAIPITINQCNGTGNAGGTLLTCSASVLTNITAAVVTAAPTASGGTATPQITAVPTGGVPAGADEPGGLSPSGLLALGTALLMAAAATALLGWRRAARKH
jgi:hypothetical protein